MTRCEAKRTWQGYTCVACNLTWSVKEGAPPCRPHYYGDQKLAEIRKMLTVGKSEHSITK